MKGLFGLAKLMVIMTCLGATAFADVKVKTRQTMGGQTFELTTLIKNKRQRMERSQGGMEMINITQCDLRRDLQIMPQAKAYLIESYDQDVNTQPANQTPAQVSAPTQKGGVITSVVTTRDTGERKQMFGYTARHIITTMETESSPDACTVTKSKMQQDGWYIDAAFALDCANTRYRNYRPASGKSGCHDRYETKQIGGGKTGFPVYEKMTMFDENGKESMSFINEVLEISNATLDATLFDIPAGYRQVNNSTELYASLSAEKVQSASDEGHGDASGDSSSGLNASVEKLSKTSANVSATVGEKKPGVIRLGLTTVRVGSVGAALNEGDLASAVGNSLAEQLQSSTVELVSIQSQSPAQIDAEAKQKGCDFVIYANASHKKGGGGFGGMFGNVIAPAVGQVGLGHTGSVAGNVAGQIATAAIVTAGTMSVNVKSKDEMTLDIKVGAPGTSTQTLAKQFKAKAKTNGEDIITPLAGQAARAIMGTTTQN